MQCASRVLSTARGGAWDVVVIGGGHAGCEAAAAACRAGARTLLVTQRVDTIGVMSCNPSIGGIGKGTLVREVDAMGGLMGRVADASGIHFRMLNRSKGEAVWGPRCQVDRLLYQRTMHGLVTGELRERGLELVEASVEDLELEAATGGGPPRLTGVRLGDGRVCPATTVVVTTGTFLRGRLLLGGNRSEGGRIGERPAVGLARTFERLGLELGRLKTGTPPRLDGRRISWSRLAPQPGDDSPEPFSTLSDEVGHAREQLCCYMTRTNSATHAVVSGAQHLAPAHEGAEPRYCPSIDSKVRRFADRASHQVWLEPEGLPEHTHLVYPNGISTALPPSVQLQLVRTIVGLERVDIETPGYAVEYDFVQPTQLAHTLQLRAARGVYLAGQINGTTGYEEAAAQGLVAGANAALDALGMPALTLARDEALTGVLIDDLVRKGASEPYRMFTSRAENRLILRADNADLRLTRRALGAGVLCERADAERLRRVRARADALDEGERALRSIVLPPTTWRELRVPCSQDGTARSAWEMVGSRASHARGGGAHEVLSRLTDAGYALPELAEGAWRQLVTTARYEPYVEQQRAQADALQAHGRLPLPTDLQYDRLVELSAEERERLARARPGTLAEAAGLEGITATGMEALLRYARRGRGTAAASTARAAAANAPGGDTEPAAVISTTARAAADSRRGNGAAPSPKDTSGS